VGPKTNWVAVGGSSWKISNENSFPVLVAPIEQHLSIGGILRLVVMYVGALGVAHAFDMVG